MTAGQRNPERPIGLSLDNMDTLTRIYQATLSSPPSHIPSPMECLPQDILVLILQSIESLRSLRAAVLASSAMNNAFRTAKIETLARVVSRSRPEELSSDAVALSVLIHMRHGPTSKTAKALVDRNLQHPRHEWLFLPKSVSAPELLRFHWYVEYFTEKLFKASMRHVHRKGWTRSEKLSFRRPSPNETIRIQRALYRLEFFSSYAELEPTNNGQLTGTAYWRKHVSVWEMEEIACIQNLIFQRLAVVDDVILSVFHSLGLSTVARSSESPGKKAWLKIAARNAKSLLTCHRLSTLFRILTEPSKQSTRRIIHEAIREHFLSPTKPFRAHNLSNATSAVVPHFVFVGSETEKPATLHLERLRNWEERPGYPSYGYSRAYRSLTLELVEWGYTYGKHSSLYNEAKHHEDRMWGYCLWDQNRIDFWADELHFLRTRSQLRVTSRGSPGWTTTRLN